MKYKINKKEDALIIVDVQKDFCPDGALPVPEGDKVVLTLNGYVKKFREAGALIVATRDWHPPNHTSFKAYGGIWPAHCVQGNEGAEFHPDLELPRGTKIVSKAANSAKEAYSGFDETGLREDLKVIGIKRVFIGGLATEYCVKSTVLDALKFEFKALVLEDAARGVDVKPGDSERAIKEMIERGTEKITLPDLE